MKMSYPQITQIAQMVEDRRDLVFKF